MSFVSSADISLLSRNLVAHVWFATKLTMEKEYIHRLEGRVRKVRLQDVFDGDNVVMFEMLEDLQLSQCAFGICQHLKGIGDLLYCHLLAWTNTAGQTGCATEFE